MTRSRTASVEVYGGSTRSPKRFVGRTSLAPPSSSSSVLGRGFPAPPHSLASGQLLTRLFAPSTQLAINEPHTRMSYLVGRIASQHSFCDGSINYHDRRLFLSHSFKNRSSIRLSTCFDAKTPYFSSKGKNCTKPNPVVVC